MRFKLIFLTFLVTGCLGTYKAFQTEQEIYPVFFIGYWYSWDAYIFAESIVYQRGWTDSGPMLSRRFPSFHWTAVNDSTIHLHPISKYDQKKHPNGLTFLLRTSSKRCQLLIPIDSVYKFDEEIKPQFDEQVVNYRFEPDDEDQRLIDIDSARIYHRLEADNFSEVVSRFSEQFRKLGVLNGSGF